MRVSAPGSAHPGSGYVPWGVSLSEAVQQGFQGLAVPQVLQGQDDGAILPETVGCLQEGALAQVRSS